MIIKLVISIIRNDILIFSSIFSTSYHHLGRKIILGTSHRYPCNASRPLLRCRPRLHELQHRGELVPTRIEIMGKIGASILLSYSGLVLSYVTHEGLGFVRVLHSRVVVSSCSYIREIAKQSTRSLWALCGQPALIWKKHHCLVQSR